MNLIQSRKKKKESVHSWMLNQKLKQKKWMKWKFMWTSECFENGGTSSDNDEVGHFGDTIFVEWKREQVGVLASCFVALFNFAVDTWVVLFFLKDIEYRQVRSVGQNRN